MKKNRWTLRITLGVLCGLFLIYLISDKTTETISFMYADF